MCHPYMGHFYVLKKKSNNNIVDLVKSELFSNRSNYMYVYIYIYIAEANVNSPTLLKSQMRKE